MNRIEKDIPTETKPYPIKLSWNWAKAAKRKSKPINLKKFKTIAKINFPKLILEEYLLLCDYNGG
jgi:hypothetical protein